MASFIHQPNLTEGLSLIGWRLKRDAEIEGFFNFNGLLDDILFFKHVKMKPISNVKLNLHLPPMPPLNSCPPLMITTIHTPVKILNFVLK